MKRYIRAAEIEDSQGEMMIPKGRTSKRMSYFKNRIKEYYGPEYDIPKNMYDAIIQRWAQIAESECWAGGLSEIMEQCTGRSKR